jgi:hypothetical protein
MQVRFIAKDPGSQVGNSPTLFATDRTDRKTYVVQGWIVKDPEAVAGVGELPAGEAIIEVPADLFQFLEEQR